MAFTRSGVRSPSPPLLGAARAWWDQRDSMAGGARRRCAAAERTLNSKPLAGIAQLVEHNLAKVGVAGSSPVSRSQLHQSELRKVRAAGIWEEWPGHTGTRRGVEQSGSSPGS